MSTQFLQLNDGIIVQIDSPLESRKEMHTSTAERVGTSMETAASTLQRIIRTIASAFGGLYETLDVPVAIDSAEVELGLSFSAEGNLFVASSKTEGTLKVKVKFQRIEDRSVSSDKHGESA